jgi:hypothetical protein
MNVEGRKGNLLSYPTNRSNETRSYGCYYNLRSYQFRCKNEQYGGGTDLEKPLHAGCYGAAFCVDM